MKTKTTTDTVEKEIEKEFEKKFPNKMAEVIDDFGSTLKPNIKSFIKAQIRKAVREERKKHICKIGGDLLRNKESRKMKKGTLTLKKLNKPYCDIVRVQNTDIVSQIFTDLDVKMYTSGVFKKINVRSYSLIRKKYGVLPYSKKT